MNQKIKIYKIDAQGQVLGRLASRLAKLLMGKDDPNYQPNILRNIKVVVFNTDKIRVTGKKMEQKIYYHHAGYLGHLKKTPLAKMMKQDSRQVLRRAVFGMLPANRLRKKRLKMMALYRGQIKE